MTRDEAIELMRDGKKLYHTPTQLTWEWSIYPDGYPVCIDKHSRKYTCECLFYPAYDTGWEAML